MEQSITIRERAFRHGIQGVPSALQGAQLSGASLRRRIRKSGAGGISL